MEQRTWFITGISSGFGRHMTEQLLERGDKVAGTVRNMNSVDDLKEKYGSLLWVAHLDVTDVPTVYKVVDQAFNQLGKIDVIVSNAGYGLIGAAEELTIDQITHQINTNLLGSIHLIRASLPHLRTQIDGHIIQLSSSGGQTAYPGGARTNFRNHSLILWQKLEAYSISQTQNITSIVSIGDPAKMAKIMIDSVDQQPAPKRITLGNGAYNSIRQSLLNRLEELESQKELAFSTDFSTNE